MRKILGGLCLIGLLFFSCTPIETVTVRQLNENVSGGTKWTDKVGGHEGTSTEDESKE
jgi:hypothetical protein